MTKSVPGKQIFYFNTVIPPPQHIIHSPSQWHSSTGQLCEKHLHLFEPYHSSLLFSVRLPSNSKTPSNPKLQEELRPGDQQIKINHSQMRKYFSKSIFLDTTQQNLLEELALRKHKAQPNSPCLLNNLYLLVHETY